ncbi:hypothetical protein L618_000300003960 [Rhodococcus rhodochrous J45]|uniref:Uncharacterized protein n=1 Tax=Rhodococcus rhodochrous J45 TaxID=935266 RepID=A0A562E1E3_RHORH|nr:hypothetical protein L618_000300003960 [Rhodococcus rhodochrous J45]
MGRIRKRRFAALTLLGLVPATLLGAGIARGDLPMNLAISGQDISGTIGLVEAEGIQVFPVASTVRRATFPPPRSRSSRRCCPTSASPPSLTACRSWAM